MEPSEEKNCTLMESSSAAARNLTGYLKFVCLFCFYFFFISQLQGNSPVKNSLTAVLHWCYANDKEREITQIALMCLIGLGVDEY